MYMSLPKCTISKKSITVMTDGGGGGGGCFGETIHCIETIPKRALCINMNDDINIYFPKMQLFICNFQCI